MATEKPVLRFGLKAVYFGAIAGAALGAMLIRLSPDEYDKWGPFIANLARFVKAHTWTVVVMAPLAAVTKAASEYLTRRWLLGVVQALLTDYCDTVFSGKTGPKDDHRVTLFAYRKFAVWKTLPWTWHRLPWSGWLVPIARSGHATQKVRARFLAPDQAVRAEGVAGMTWRNRSIVTLPNLPELTQQSTSTDIDAYCQKTCISSKWAKSRIEAGEFLPRALRGLPVEVANELWGVAILDSKDEDAFSKDPHGTEGPTFMFSLTIGRLLQRARL